jgi:hypothetical protein
VCEEGWLLCDLLCEEENVLPKTIREDGCPNPNRAGRASKKMVALSSVSETVLKLIQSL